jgi:hypothetical protein
LYVFLTELGLSGWKSESSFWVFCSWIIVDYFQRFGDIVRYLMGVVFLDFLDELLGLCLDIVLYLVGVYIG